MKHSFRCMAAAVAALAACASFSAGAADEAKAPTAMVVVYHIAPGKHLDFLKWQAARDAYVRGLVVAARGGPAVTGRVILWSHPGSTCAGAAAERWDEYVAQCDGQYEQLAEAALMLPGAFVLRQGSPEAGAPEQQTGGGSRAPR
mgnify:CR=1 FL=1